jgi:hypothetical protein
MNQLVFYKRQYREELANRANQKLRPRWRFKRGVNPFSGGQLFGHKQTDHVQQQQVAAEGLAQKIAALVATPALFSAHCSIPSSWALIILSQRPPAVSAHAVRSAGALL